MADRRRQLEQLLATRYDQLWLPSGSLRTTGGFAPGERRPCPRCSTGTRPGWIVPRRGIATPCVACGGRAEPRPDGHWRNKDAGRGYVFVDAMDTLEQPVGDQETAATSRPRRTVTCDACNGAGAVKGERCRYCQGEGRRDLHVFDLRLDTGELDAVPDPVAAAIERRDQSGSYHELDQAIAGVKHHVDKPLKYAALSLHGTRALRLLDEVYLPPERDPATLTWFEKELLDTTLAYLDTRMPDPIRVPADVRANAKILRDRRTRVDARTRPGARAVEQRNKEIRRLLKQGKPAQWVAGEYGLHVSTVYEIAKQRERVA